MSFMLRSLAVLVTALPLACSAGESGGKFQLGKDYTALRVPQATADSSKIEVMEVFAYSCPHCFHLESEVARWLARKPADVAFVRMPHTLGNQANALRNKAFYASQMLGVFEPFHKALFGAIHGQGKAMATQDELRALFVEATRVKAEDFDGAFSSFAVDSRFRIAESTLREMGIPSVPTLVVEGKYQVKNSPQVFAVVDHLVEQARKERKSR